VAKGDEDMFGEIWGRCVCVWNGSRAVEDTFKRLCESEGIVIWDEKRKRETQNEHGFNRAEKKIDSNCGIL
jgi:hypothetical protein